jgi:pilus assembly protein CpaB
MKTLILIFIALGCGLVASIGISQVMERGGNSGPGMEMEQILVALADIDPNAKLDATNIKLEDWPKSKVPEGAIRRLADANGKFTGTRFYKGEPILFSKISDSARGVAQHIPPGFRAEPVKVEEDTVMKAISPGDRVDVSVFLKKDGNEVIKTGIFKILTNVQIFAVNSNTERSSEAKGESAFRTVSLLVKEKQVGELQLAKRMGSIQLSLRSPTESDDDVGEGVTPLSELFAAKAEQGSNDGPGSSASGLSQFLDVPPVTAEAAGGPAEWQMLVQGPNGFEQWDWLKRDGLPNKSTTLSMTGSGAPAPAADAPSTPSGAPPTTETEAAPQTAPEPAASDEPVAPTG